LLALVALIAGLQNALAGGGSFLTFPALLITGLAARGNVPAPATLSLGELSSISLFGGACGALWPCSSPSPYTAAISAAASAS
jgi:uncharacterized membrane protein YfcA